MHTVIMHIGSDHINRKVGLHNCLSHYADIQDAAARHKYVQSVVSTVHSLYDYLGKPYTRATEQQGE